MKYFIYAILFLMILVSCSKQRESSIIKNGKSKFSFQDESLNKGKAIDVFTYVPQNYNENTPILFIMHGNKRTAEKYRNDWISIADSNNAVLVAPLFSRENGFPEDDHYNMGNMFKMDEEENLLDKNPESEWSYSLINPIFDFVVKDLKNNSKSYMIYGHSAGSQFVHRFLFFKPEAKVTKAVCANAGWYTMPEFDQTFPYGLKNTTASKNSLKKLYQKNVAILLGDQDIDVNHKSLRRTPEAMKQGVHRFERGHSFFEANKNWAKELDVEFNWKLETVPGVAHSNSGMAKGAVNSLF